MTVALTPVNQFVSSRLLASKGGVSPKRPVSRQPRFAGQFSQPVTAPVSNQQLVSALKGQVKFGSLGQLISIAPGYKLGEARAAHNQPLNRMPSIILESATGDKIAIDPVSANFERNIIEFTEDFNQDSARAFNAQVDFLKNKILDKRAKGEIKDPSEETVHIYINSPGGMIISLYAMIDAVDTLKKANIPVATYCRGMAASCGSVLFALGTPGQRYMTPHGRVLVHQPLGGSYGQATDIGLQNEEIQEMKIKLTDILSLSALEGKIIRLQKEVDRLSESENQWSPNVQARQKQIAQFEAEKVRIRKTQEARTQQKIYITQAEMLKAEDRSQEAEEALAKGQKLVTDTIAAVTSEAREQERQRLTEVIANSDGATKTTAERELRRLDDRKVPYSSTRERMAQVMERDRWLTAEEAVEYGLADGIVTR